MGGQNMTYKQALKQAEKVGAARCEGLPLLAQTLATLALAHAINPELCYKGAVNRGWTAKEVRALDPVGLGCLMFDS